MHSGFETSETTFQTLRNYVSQLAKLMKSLEPVSVECVYVSKVSPVYKPARAYFEATWCFHDVSRISSFVSLESQVSCGSEVSFSVNLLI